VDRYFSTTIGF